MLEDLMKITVLIFRVKRKSKMKFFGVSIFENTHAKKTCTLVFVVVRAL